MDNKEIEEEFIKEGHWLICDCDLELKENCKIKKILPYFRKSLKKVENRIKEEFINGERCLSCGRKKESELSDTCLKCLEEL